MRHSRLGARRQRGAFAMSTRRLAGISLVGALLLAAVPALAKGPPRPLSDWPCDTPFAGPLDAAMLWPGADEHGAAAGAWEADPVAHRLVDFLTAGENSAAMGQREVEDYVARNGALKPETSLRVVAGMVERGNKLRLILLEGIKKQIIKSHVLAAAVDENTAQLCHRLVYDEAKLKTLATALRAHTE